MGWVHIHLDQGGIDRESLATDQTFNDAGAQFGLGLHYLVGDGVPQNNDLGTRWIRKAAEQGMAEAQYTLGNLK
ncbi:MAG: SEL1-like repeat protein [Rhodospirillales bacterium]|nr:SEL1-like repeat protein [Rhodospirillaceae bacterium]MBT6111106.1 SEL1-like repeat protein [Rhodospirillales bacterium]MBT6587732.1 SEL1-like repeat protein [Rhodospirillaceae bacterium]MBT7755643.1 SEL1-like repeat protein [Candidatus Magasanikbacteria bacterium]